MSMFSQQTVYRRGLTGLVTLLVATVLSVVLTHSASAELRYEYDDGLVARIKAQTGHACLSQPLPILTTPYVSRLIDQLYKSCVTDNVTKEQIAKYAALGAGTLAGGGAVTVPYATGELASDGLKCVLKSYVNASSMSASEKEKYRGWVDTGAAVKDWVGFAGSIKGLANASSAEVTKAFADYSWSGTERIGDAHIFADAYNTLSDSLSVRGFKEMNWHASAVTLDEYDDYIAGCQYSRARLSLDRAEEEADLECKALGHSFRVAEQELASKMANPRNKKVYAIDPTGLTETARFLLGSLSDLEGELEDADKDLKKHIEVFADIKKRRAELKTLADDFKQDRETYAQLYEDTLKALDTPHACYAIKRLRQDVIRLLNPNHNSSSCYAELQKGGPAGGTLTPDSFAQALWELKQKRLTVWWAEVDKIRTALHECKTSEAFAARDRLRSEITSNPVFEVRQGECVPANQATLLAALTGMVEPVTCKMTAVPEDIIGLSVAEAADLIRDAGLYLSGPFSVVELKEGAKPNTVLDSKPAPGAPLRVWSPVTLTVYGDAPKEEPDAELVDVPTVIGLADDAARKALTAVGLVPAYAEEIPADKEDMVPGNIFAASHIAGDQLPKGSTVTLTKIGPRPTVTVPSIAGAKTMDEVRTILAGAKLTAGAEFEAAPMPEGATPGEFFASDPAADTPVEMFSSVTPMRYPSDLRPVPRVLTMDAEKAVELINEDGFFTGAATPGRIAKEGEEPLKVLSVSPAVGTMLPEGSVVTVTVIMPRTDLEDVPEVDLVEEEAADDGDIDVPPVLPPPDDDTSDLREIPHTIIGMPAGKAAELLRGADDFLNVPKPRKGYVAQDGQIPGTVQISAPAPGTMVERGSTVLLYIYRMDTQGSALKACPEVDPDPSRSGHEIDSNNNPNDETFLSCLYFDDGRLSSQLPYTDGLRDGVWLQYFISEHCGRFLQKTETFAKDVLLEETRHACDEKTGTPHQWQLRLHKDGKLLSETRFKAKDVRSSHTDYVSGKVFRVLSYDENGMQRGCRQLGSDGRMRKCP